MHRWALPRCGSLSAPPLLLATFAAVVAVRAERPETGEDSKRSRFVRRVERAGQQALDGLAFTLPLAALSLGFVWVLPLSDAAENATVGPAMVCAAVGGFVVARSIRRSTGAAE